ncbi:DNA-binding transcriptional LysR family regulator [Microbacterium resistens]|uniref:DNA-binding transcriptional LysR family regulator n=2 Tax=Microbacterium resistens TaxID=156977 RepID=A0ABU1SE55_9MICO|nr:DNA-binding transcriptional LysR family regulator [Microbacterium resistens]
MPGRWIDTWKRRMPEVGLVLTEIAYATQRAALDADEIDIALVREPFDRAGMHAIPLYTEVTVVVAAADSHLMAADELDAEDLAGEVLLQTVEDVLGTLDLPATPAAIAPIETLKDAVATVAAGTGILILPMSLARLHHRKDVDYRPLRGGPTSPVLLAWPEDRTTTDVEAFIGIVRGRTANSSR